MKLNRPLYYLCLLGLLMNISASANDAHARWTLQTGTTSLNYTGQDLRNDIVIGYTGEDTEHGGLGDDTLVGDGGADKLYEDEGEKDLAAWMAMRAGRVGASPTYYRHA
jgi:Ca2+-binding RTX toxin-like protein